ncbi:MAG: ornithine carbamoyltransferase [Anaerolineae bacterium]|nr:ornithine carbamoyltransferase [Anaerolineae bacterium]MDW8099580.1 ornithine carbamoyltransferase [Anaerolineae bacterium]
MSLRHFLSMADLTPSEVWDLLLLAHELKREWQAGGNRPLLKGKSLGMLFQKPSLRTRVSFEIGMIHLGGHALYLSPQEVGLGSRESVPDVARVLSRYVDGIVARVFEQAVVEQLAAHSRVPVINGLSDYSHPCQALADLFTIWEVKGRLDGIRLAYVGDSNNVARSLAFASALVGIHMVIASPPGYQLDRDTVARVEALAKLGGGSLQLTEDPLTAVADADVIYTDTWTSMGQEHEAERRRQVFPPYQVNAMLVARAKPDVIVMHCLPAHRGEEITDDVADGPHSVLFDQAENRLHAQKSLLVRLLGSTG